MVGWRAGGIEFVFWALSWTGRLTGVTGVA